MYRARICESRIRHAAERGGWRPIARRKQTVSHAARVGDASLAPFILKMAGPVYLAAALVLGFGFSGLRQFNFAAAHAGARAANMFLASIIYLPLLLSAMFGTR